MFPHLCTTQNCTNCKSCMAACNHGAINFVVDDCGFSSPFIDEKKCVQCGLCEQSCPILSPFEKKKEKPCVYALYSKDKENLLSSSSGGVFFELAKFVIRKGGCVFGVVCNNGDFIYHCAESLDEVEPMKGSKYVQAETSGVYKQIKRKLQEKRTVLFTGTPCQIAGVQAYLKKDYGNLLITVDLVCHGNPPQTIFEHCMNLNNIPREKRAIVKFRDTRTGSYLTRYAVNTFSQKWNYIFWSNDLYMRLFMKAVIFKPVCYTCPFAKVPRISDLTLGDFWGIKNSNKFKAHRAGTSVLLVNTQTGNQVWQQVKKYFVYEERTLSEAVLKNRNIVEPTSEPERRVGMVKDLFVLKKKDYIKKYKLQLTLRNIFGFLLRRVRSKFM